MQQNWYRKLLLSYFPIFLITITILVFLSFIIVNEASREEAAKANEISTRFITESLDRSINTMEMNVLNEVETSSLYSSYLFSNGSSDENIMYSLVKRLRGLVNDNDLIESIYIYRHSDQSVLTNSGHTSLELFSDRAFLEASLNKQDYRGWSAVRSKASLRPSEPAKQVISMYKSLPLPFGSQGLLVINVDTYRVEQMIAPMINDSVSFLNVIGPNGTKIFGASRLGEDNRGKEGKVLTTLTSRQLGWTLESGLRSGQLYAWVSVVSYIWIVIGVVTVVLAIVYIIYITRRNYQPIKAMMNRIESIQLSMPQAAKDELSMIDSALESLISRSMDYDKKQHENLQLQRSQLFIDLIGGQKSEEELESRMRELSPVKLPEQPHPAGYVMMLGEIDDYSGFRDEHTVRDQNVLKFAFMNVFQELSRNSGFNSWMEWITGSRVGILIVLPAAEDESRPALIQAAEECQRWVEEKLRMSLCFGMGSTVSGIHEIGASYRSASEALEHRLAMGDHAVLVGDDLSRGDFSHLLPYLTEISELVKDFRLNNDGWRVRLQNMFESFKKERLKDELIRSLLRSMLQLLSREVGVLSDELRTQLSEGKDSKLSGAASLEELQSRTSDLLTEIYRTYVALSETKSYRAMINEMKIYIEEHFDDPDLSLKHLSDRFQISGKYASYLFKMEYDMKFVDFLVQLRMNRAEELLTETDLSIQEIAEKIGYANSITFGRVFKRTAGVTPGDYRKLKVKPSPGAEL
ncbi:helix-turn-helix domain-containing protein [Paenibacillus lemnae]|uniref:Helix-turn-helix domain-containing protein n=1 Tax=Paenibacillus lemnae TaxID=1330551 RepID=A0A848M905_PAELE|nr:helix-turn-helix domain-containing protein [Paenibacillus lemnae]